MRLSATDLAQRLGRQAEAVCRFYLSNGRKNGNYWQVGDARNTPGRSMFVRLTDSPKGPPGKWSEHVAARVMLRWRYLARFCLGFRGAGQHNLSATGGCS